MASRCPVAHSVAPHLYDVGAAPLSLQTALLAVGVVVFAVVFAINSSIHSYLVVRYAAGEKVPPLQLTEPICNIFLHILANPREVVSTAFSSL